MAAAHIDMGRKKAGSEGYGLAISQSVSQSGS